MTLLARWRRWRRVRHLKARRSFTGDPFICRFLMITNLVIRDINRRHWQDVLRKEDAEYRQRMRGGYPG